MADSYRVLSDISTLGPQGSTITDADIVAAHVSAELLIASGIIEPITKPAKNQES